MGKTSASIQMLAHLLLLLGVCSVASLRGVGTSTQIGAVGPLVGPACLRFSDKHADATDSTFEEPSGKADWFVCSGPSDDPELSCFLAPDWMDIEKVDGKDNWDCVRGLHDVDTRKNEALFGEDSY